MRIIRGHLKTRKFSVPKGLQLRPTTDFAKEGLFNILETRFAELLFEPAHFLDLCAGTGSISFEWISRDLGTVTAVDSNYHAVNHIRASAKLFDEIENIRAVCSDVLQFLKKTSETYQLIFADPPYEARFHEKIVALVFERELLKQNGILIVEHGKQTDLSHIPNFTMSRKYGNVIFSFFAT